MGKHNISVNLENVDIIEIEQLAKDAQVTRGAIVRILVCFALNRVRKGLLIIKREEKGYYLKPGISTGLQPEGERGVQGGEGKLSGL